METKNVNHNKCAPNSERPQPYQVLKNLKDLVKKKIKIHDMKWNARCKINDIHGEQGDGPSGKRH